MRIQRSLALTAFLFLCSTSLLFSNDTGILEHFLNLDAKLPQRGEAITPEQATEAVSEHIRNIQRGNRDSEALTEYWTDYRTVLSTWSDVSSAKPVLIEKEDGSVLVCPLPRWSRQRRNGWWLLGR